MWELSQLPLGTENYCHPGEGVQPATCHLSTLCSYHPRQTISSRFNHDGQVAHLRVYLGMSPPTTDTHTQVHTHTHGHGNTCAQYSNTPEDEMPILWPGRGGGIIFLSCHPSLPRIIVAVTPGPFGSWWGMRGAATPQ
jgi:hypothetical protein